jgi:hypothetical protein
MAAAVGRAAGSCAHARFMSATSALGASARRMDASHAGLSPAIVRRAKSATPSHANRPVSRLDARMPHA